jgi:hypothetical protein
VQVDVKSLKQPGSASLKEAGDSPPTFECSKPKCTP